MRGTLTPALAARIGASRTPVSSPGAGRHQPLPGTRNTDSSPGRLGQRQINPGTAPGRLAAPRQRRNSRRISGLGRRTAGVPGNAGGPADRPGRVVPPRGLCPAGRRCRICLPSALPWPRSWRLDSKTGGRAGRRCSEAVRRVASLTGLDRLLDRDPARISGGELRRLAIGCAIITGPAVLVLDEPFASLDTDGAAALTALVRSLVAGGTAVVVLSQAVDALLSGADQLDPAEPTARLLLRRHPGATGRFAGARCRRRHRGRLTQRATPPPQRPAAGPIPAGVGSVPAGVPALELRDVSFAYDRPRARSRFRRARCRHR